MNARILRAIVVASVLLFSVFWQSIALGDHCPADRPYHRGGNACDSCDWKEVIEQYKTGELSTTRSSRLFDHEIRVSVLCDVNRPVDVDDVFTKLDETEMELLELFGRLLDRSQGVVTADDGETVTPKVLEVVVGICDYGDGVDDCVMWTLCAYEWGWNCGVASGQAWPNTPNDATHTAFVPQLPDGVYWWNDENIYKNLQHEFTHLLDFTYLRPTLDRRCSPVGLVDRRSCDICSSGAYWNDNLLLAARKQRSNHARCVHALDPTSRITMTACGCSRI